MGKHVALLDPSNTHRKDRSHILYDRHNSQCCLEDIVEGEPWHYRHDRRTGRFEPIHDKCTKETVREVSQ